MESWLRSTRRPRGGSKRPTSEGLWRALEVYLTTGRPISELQAQHDKPAPSSVQVYAIQAPRPLLHERINARVELTFGRGLVDEVRCLISAPRGLGKTASQAIGYREVKEHFEGVRGLPETIDLVKTRTRQFAKRQETWFRGLEEVRFEPVVEMHSPRESALRLLKRIQDAARLEEPVLPSALAMGFPGLPTPVDPSN